MTLRDRYRKAAQDEFDSSVDYYEAAQIGLGARFAGEVRRVVAGACKDPRRYPIAVRDIREAYIPGFPYCVYYRVRSPYLIVVAVYHQSRDPSGWKGRA
jgi:plasmid stabilization system protein ParE